MNAPIPEPVEQVDMVELRIPCKAEWVAVARLAIAAVANRLDFSIEDIEDVKLAVAEACTNCIQNIEGANSIEITCETSPTELTVRVCDIGSASRPAANSFEEGGGSLGIFLIRSLMDSVDLDTTSERGTCLVMTKKVKS